MALSKKQKYSGFNKYTPTKRILKLWQANITYQKRKSIAEKIAKTGHISIKEAIKEVPYYKKMFKNESMRTSISKELGLNSAEVEWIRR